MEARPKPTSGGPKTLGQSLTFLKSLNKHYKKCREEVEKDYQDEVQRLKRLVKVAELTPASSEAFEKFVNEYKVDDVELEKAAALRAALFGITSRKNPAEPRIDMENACVRQFSSLEIRDGAPSTSADLEFMS